MLQQARHHTRHRQLGVDPTSWSRLKYVCISKPGYMTEYKHTLNEVDTNVDNDCTRFYPRALDESRLTDSRYNDIGLFNL